MTWREARAVKSALEEQFAGDPWGQYGLDEESVRESFPEIHQAILDAERLLDRLREVWHLAP